MQSLKPRFPHFWMAIAVVLQNINFWTNTTYDPKSYLSFTWWNPSVSLIKNRPNPWSFRHRFCWIPQFCVWKIPMFGAFIELEDGKIYRKALYLMVKPWFPVDFPLNQSSDCWFIIIFPTKIWTNLGVYDGIHHQKHHFQTDTQKCSQVFLLETAGKTPRLGVTSCWF